MKLKKEKKNALPTHPNIWKYIKDNNKQFKNKMK